MTMLISMAYTTPAIVNRGKCVTRRNWTIEYANRFKDGEVITAYSKSPRYGGVPIAHLRIKKPYYQKTGLHREPDKFHKFYEDEGFKLLDRLYAEATGNKDARPLYQVALDWVYRDTWHWVLEFEIVDVIGNPTNWSNDEFVLDCVKKLMLTFGSD